MQSTCVIVGSGLAGLTAAQTLRSHGFTVKLLEKSRGVGGRMATRRSDFGVFDHGTQSLAPRSHRFQTMVETWHAKGLLQPRVLIDGFAGDEPSLHYIGVPSMTAVPKHMASDLDVHLLQRVVSLVPHEEGWQLHCETGEEHTASCVILTPPLPQTLQILDVSGLVLPQTLSSELRSIAYEPCIALMVALQGPSAIPDPGVMRLGPEPVRWVADNGKKGIATREGLVTVCAGPHFSHSHYHQADSEVIPVLLESIHELLGGVVVWSQLHRWRYCRPLYQAAHAAVVAHELPPLVLAGDAFGGPHVEGAALSGLAAADLLVSLFQGTYR